MPNLVPMVLERTSQGERRRGRFNSNHRLNIRLSGPFSIDPIVIPTTGH